MPIIITSFYHKLFLYQEEKIFLVPIYRRKPILRLFAILYSLISMKLKNKLNVKHIKVEKFYQINIHLKRGF